MTEFALEDMSVTRRVGKRVCFVQMSDIGPLNSDRPEQWARFESEDAALRDVAVSHPFGNYQAVLVPAVGEVSK